MRSRIKLENHYGFGANPSLTEPFPDHRLHHRRGLFLLSLITNSDDLKRASLVVLLGISLLAIPAYISGNGAQDAVKPLASLSKAGG